MHARVNFKGLPLDNSKTYSLDEIISALESEKSIKQVVLERQKSLGGYLYFEKSMYKHLSKLQTEDIKLIKKPFNKLE